MRRLSPKRTDRVKKIDNIKSRNAPAVDSAGTSSDRSRRRRSRSRESSILESSRGNERAKQEVTYREGIVLCLLSPTMLKIAI